MNEITTTPKSPVMVKIKILDQTGDTTLERAIDEAIQIALTYKFTQGKNMNVRSATGLAPFELSAKNAQDTEGLVKDTTRLHTMLEQFDKPAIYMTGELAGGTN